MKRRRQFSPTNAETFLISSANMPAVPKYLVAKRIEDDFAKVSPFLIDKANIGCTRSAIQDIRKVAGGLLIETLNDKQTSRLLKLQKIGN